MSDSDKKPPSRGEPPAPPPSAQEMLEQLRSRLGASGVFSIPLNFPQGRQEEPEEPAEEEPRSRAEVLKFDLTPAQVKEHLDRFVIGQDEAKKTLAVAVCDHYNHIRREQSPLGKSDPIDYVKQNVILLGPTGVGKTYLIRNIASLIGVPFVKADVTKFSETGYVGGDVDDLVRELVRSADGDVELAEYGIVFLDEIDKIASASNLMGRDVSGRGVQTGLLKLLEETEVSVRGPNDMMGQLQELMQSQKGRKPSKRAINTKHILFVVSGAFTGLPEIIEKRLSERSVGFGALSAAVRAEEAAGPGLFHQVTTRDFVDYGFEPEFVGRLPVRVALEDLSEEDLFAILATSEGSIIKQHRESFHGYGISAIFEDDALRAVARQAIQEKTGARGLMTVLEAALRPLKFALPRTPVQRFAVTREIIEAPREGLKGLLESPQKAAERYVTAIVRAFEKDFEHAHGVRLAFDDASVAMAASFSEGLHTTIPKYLSALFEPHVPFLQRVRQETGLERFPVTPQILHRPQEGVDLWLGRPGSAKG